MLESFFKLSELIKTKEFKISNQKLNSLIFDYFFYSISDSLSQNSDLLSNAKKSSAAIIDRYLENNQNSIDAYFIISINKTIIFIKQSSLSVLQSVFSNNPQLNIFFLSDIQDIFEQYIQTKLNKSTCDETFREEILNFNENIVIQCDKKSKFLQIWNIILPCISGYLIKESYAKLNTKNTFELTQNLNFSESDFIVLRNIGIGSSFTVYLIYHIVKEELFVIKKPNNISEESKLLKREVDNYLQIKYPLLPKFYGTIKYN